MQQNFNIALIPLDNRPVSYTLPQQVASLNKNIETFVPPREFLGGLIKPADVNKILNWLENTLKTEKIDCIICAVDTIAYGGLVSSRRTTDSYKKILDRIEQFKQIIGLSDVKVYAFSSIMRISDSDVNEEEKDYWDKYGKLLFKYSFLSHKITTESANTLDEADLESIFEQIPADILEDYIKTRERNFSVNRYCLSETNNGFFDFLAFSKDDTASYGMNILEAQALHKEIQDKNIQDKAVVQTGADEILTDLLSRAIIDFYKEKISIYPVFSTENGKNVIPRYEDKPIWDSVKGQIQICGAELADSEEAADLIILVHTPQQIQNDHCLKIYPEKENKKAVNFCIEALTDAKKPLLIADLACANGADNLLVQQILIKISDITSIYGYAAWNTAGNALGTTISTAISRFIAEKQESFDKENFKKLLFVRYSDDWAYQTVVRQTIRALTSEADIRILREEMLPLVSGIAKKLGFSGKNIELSFPWDRTFEAEIDI